VPAEVVLEGTYFRTPTDSRGDFPMGGTPQGPYRLVYSALVVVGAVFPLRLVWNLADITNLLMAVPNLVAVLLLAGLVRRLADGYWATSRTEA